MKKFAVVFVLLLAGVAGWKFLKRPVTEQATSVSKQSPEEILKAETERELKDLKRADATPFERFRALVRLAEKNEPAAREEALRLRTSAESQIRSGAARALGQFDDDVALKALLEMFNDKDETVRVAAVEALGSLPSIKREPTFDMLMQTPSLPEAVKIAACTAILRGDMRGESRELATMTLVRLARAGKTPQIKTLATNQLMFMTPGHEEAQKVLRGAIESGENPETASNALFHYAQTKDKWLLERFAKLASHKERRIRLTAVRALRYACPKDSAAILANAEKDADAEIARVTGEEAKAVAASCRQ